MRHRGHWSLVTVGLLICCFACSDDSSAGATASDEEDSSGSQPDDTEDAGSGGGESTSDDDDNDNDDDSSATGAAGSQGTDDASGGSVTGQADDRFIAHEDSDLSAIPDDAIEQAKAELHIAYQHTSHGSQLITGLNSLANFPDFDELYTWSDAGESGALDLDDGGIPGGSSDLSTGDSENEDGDTPWVVGTRALLDDSANAHVNVVLWSWCSISGHDAQRYVDNMEKLIGEYPDVTFVFMTGHAEGGGEDLTEDGVHYNNQLIRKHCREHDRWLYDFADIEAYDPDGEYFWDRAMLDNLGYEDGGNWAVEWIADHPEHVYTELTMGNDGFDGTAGCAHSDSPPEANLNCVKKAAAAWNLFARLAGWDGGN